MLIGGYTLTSQGIELNNLDTALYSRIFKYQSTAIWHSVLTLLNSKGIFFIGLKI